MINNLLLIKRSTLIHIFVWAIILSLPYIFSPPDSKASPEHNAFLGFITATSCVWISYFYLNADFLIPHFFYKKKYLIYLLLLLLSFCSLAMISAALVKIMAIKFPFYVFSIALSIVPPFIFTTLVSTTYKTIYDRIRSDSIAEERQKENLKTELSFLRSQISPHFLFNVLNNVVSLVRLKSDQLEPTVLKLSSLLQYMLYETDEEKVELVDEAQYLQSYIDLQQQRFGSKVKISSSLNVNDSTHSIEPMLLIPFVENAFKHGVGLIDKPEINIELNVSENVLYFFVQNKYNPANVVKDKTSGIGLVNVQRRLALLYGKDYTLIIKPDATIYSVSLQIKLKQ